MALVEIRDLWVSYGKAKILEGVSMEVEGKELVSVIGPNGAGKTTLLRAISKVAEPQPEDRPSLSGGSGEARNHPLPGTEAALS